MTEAVLTHGPVAVPRSLCCEGLCWASARQILGLVGDGERSDRESRSRRAYRQRGACGGCSSATRPCVDQARCLKVSSRQRPSGSTVVLVCPIRVWFLVVPGERLNRPL